MTQKERVLQYCKEHLQSRELLNFFDSEAFNYIYNKKNGNTANAYTLGLTAADYIISNTKNFTNGTQYQS
jgi:PPE-repeat protein